MPEGTEKVILGLAVLVFIAWLLDRLIAFVSNPSVGIPILLVLGGGIAALIYYRRRRTRV